MSWDVVLVKEKFDLNDASYEPKPLGDRSELIVKLCSLFKDLDYSDKSWGILNRKNYSIEFNTGDKEIVDSIMLHIRGGGNPHEVIKLIISNLELQALDCSTGEFFEPKNMKTESWISFQKFRNKILSRNK